MTLYNTKTKRKEEVSTIDGSDTLRIYSCGPTVYNFAHIGNLRTYVFMDELRRALKAAGFKLKHVMNITDVGHLVSDGDDGEDKMEKAAREKKMDPYAIAAMYEKVFFDDLSALNITKPEIIARATQHIGQMIRFVQVLWDKGFAYETDDGIYFDISKFPAYGRLSGINLEDQLAGARVDVNSQKRHPADFALWKKAPKEHIMQWPSPWGMGYPGWHIECSAMGKHYLGDSFDIHTGGVDHIPIHHENEIAQSECANGVVSANIWAHGEFLLVDGGKMSKSLGNTYTVSTLGEKGYSPLSYRYFCLNAHYRSKLNFTWEAITAAQVSYYRLLSLVLEHKNGTDDITDDELERLDKAFFDAVFDDLNFPKALGVLWGALRGSKKSPKIYEWACGLDKVLGLDLGSAPPEEEKAEIPAEILAISEKRLAAKKAKDYAAADALREEAASLGWSIKDTRDGPVIEKLH